MKRSGFLRRRVPVGRAAARRRAVGGPRVKGRASLSVDGWNVLKRRVFTRDGGACRVPGCRRAIDDPHHVVKCSAGGADDENLVVSLCRAHHRECDAPWRIGRLVVGPLGEGQFQFARVWKVDKWADPWKTVVLGPVAA